MNFTGYPETRSNMDFRCVPFKYVPMHVCKNLAQLLDVRCKVFSADWTSLGAEMGLTFVQKKLMEEKMNGNGSITMGLFESWSKDPQNTVGKILDALEKIKRPHEIRMLNEAKNEILHSYFDCSDDDSIFHLSDKMSRTSDVSVDLPSETTSFSDPYYLNTYERYPSNVLSEEQNSRQPTHSIPDTSSLVDSRLGRLTEPSQCGSSMNEFVVNKHYNRAHSSRYEKIVNCGANIDKKHRVLVTYGNGNSHHDTQIFRLCRFLEKYFYCNVDLKNNRLKKSMVDEYYSQAHFILICFDQEYTRSIKQGDSDKPDELHTAYIYSKMKAETVSKGSTHRFIPLLLKGGTPDNIPLWMDKKYYRCPEEYQDLSLFLSNPQNTIHFSDATSV